MNANSTPKEKARAIVDDWKDQWMADDEAYRARILRVDANMSHSIERRITEALAEERERALNSALRAADAVSMRLQHGPHKVPESARALVAEIRQGIASLKEHQ